jgi:bacterioferritin
MKGNEKLIEVLNQLLADELAAISQYMVHSEMCDNWGFEALHEVIEARAIDEMHHSESLIERILLLEGMPVVDQLGPINIKKDIKEMIIADRDAELDAVKAYNEGIALAGEVGDEATADLLVGILKMEEGHVDWAEKQLAQIERIGMENYLAFMLGDED